MYVSVRVCFTVVLLVCSISVVKSIMKKFEVSCGQKPSIPATITLHGDFLSVFAYKNGSNGTFTTCPFEKLEGIGGYVKNISFDTSEPCGFTKSDEYREIYLINVEARKVPALGSDGDETFMAVCNYMIYATAEFTYDVK